MSNKLTELDRHFKEQLTRQEVPPPADAWASIAEQLDNQKASKPKAWHAYWGWSAAAIVIMIGYFFFTHPAGTEQDIPEKNLNTIAEVEPKITSPKLASPEPPASQPTGKETTAYKEPQERVSPAPDGIQKAPQPEDIPQQKERMLVQLAAANELKSSKTIRLQGIKKELDFKNRELSGTLKVAAVKFDQPEKSREVVIQPILNFLSENILGNKTGSLEITSDEEGTLKFALNN